MSKGFSLVELMVVAGVLAIAVMALFAAWDVGWGSWQTTDANVTVTDELRKAMDWVVEDVSAAGELTVSDVPADGAWYASLTFRKPAGIVNGYLQWSAADIGYALGGTDATQLLRVNGTDRRVVANGIKSFQVRRDPSSPGVVEIALTAEATVHRLPQVDGDLNVKVKMRN